VRSKAATSITIPTRLKRNSSQAQSQREALFKLASERVPLVRVTIPYIVVHTPDLRSPSPARVRGSRLVRCTSKAINSTTRNVQRTSESASGVNKSGFRRALGCRKRLAAQLATCSDALGTWLARAAIVGGAFMLRVSRGGIVLKTGYGSSDSSCVRATRHCSKIICVSESEFTSE
jgi:hypothetical protein